jgi:transposase
MANGKKIPDSVRKKIIAYYTNEHTMRQTATKFNVSIGVIKKIIDEGKGGKHGDFVNKVEQIKNAKANNVLDVLKNDTRILKTIDNILDIFQEKENVQAEFERKGFQGLNAVMGTIFDKALKYKALEDGIDLLGDGISIKVVNDAR